MSYLAVASSLVMMVFGGIGIDMIHAELKRTKVQATLDRAVLAAADLDNILDPTFVVEDYFEKMNMAEALVGVSVEQGLNYKEVTADARVDMSANFMEFLGVRNMQAAGTAQAREKINKVEISMVLDISGSMKDNSKLQNMKNAANTFVDTVLRDGNEDLISVNLVPYSEHVNAGPLITDHLNVDWMHGYSHCLEFPDDEFESPVLNTTMTYDQVQHFQWNYFGNNSRSDTVCPRYSYERIQPMASSRDALKNQINQLQPRAGTSIFMGMKWGAAMLDPSFRPIADNLIADGNVSADFSGRPVAYDDDETIKTVVLMTDGQHDKSFRIRDWAYNSSSEVALWARYNMWYYLVRNVHWSNRSQFYTQKYDASHGDGLLHNICESAKQSGIIIWSVGFEVTDHGADVMKSCASSPAHFFRVEGNEIEEAFFSIARTINQLRLTQ